MFLVSNNNLVKKVLFVFILIFCVFNLASSALAQAGTGSTSASYEIGKQFVAVNKTAGYDAPTDPRTIAARVIRVVLNFLGIIFLGLIVYAGFLWMTAGGAEDRVEKATKLLYRSVIGLIIILAAYSITWAAFRIALGHADEFNTGTYTQPQYK